VCSITSIGYDHTAILGDTVHDITGEKAGIIKPGSEVVLGPQQKERADTVHDVVSTAAENAGAHLYSHRKDWLSEPREDGLILTDQDGAIDLPQPALAGRHQYDNAATAAMICRRLAAQGRATITHQAVCDGVANAKQNARLQKLDDVQVSRLGTAPHNSIYVDSAHNGDAARALATEIVDWQEQCVAVALVIGMLASKDASDYLAPLAATGAQAIFTPIPGEEANMHAPARLAAIWRRHHGQGGDVFQDPYAALSHACHTAEIVVVTGSGYLLRNFV
jgi:dihydrofolate synthase/folylpolyglutamate synthase